MRRWCAVLLVAVLAVPVSGHFVFIVPLKDAGKAQVVFSDDLEPDDGVPITKIASTKVYLRQADGSGKQLDYVKGDANAYLVSLPKDGTQVLGGVTPYGVIQKGTGDPFKLTYYSRAVVGSDQAGLPASAGEPFKQLDLDVTLKMTLTKGQNLQGQVLSQGKPLAKSEVVLMLPGAKANVKLETDKDGRFGCDLPQVSGLIGVRARHIDAKPGEFGGKNYKEARSYATLVVPYKVKTAGSGVPQGPLTARAVPAQQVDVNVKQDDQPKQPPKEDVEATKLLKDARAARAVWDNFTGFTADIEVNHNGKVVRGSVEISGKGVVAVNLDDAALKDWTRRQMSSLVGHRLGNAAERDTPCAFPDTNAQHPLGRAILVLNDEMHSSYRIRERQIVEVNRTMKDVRFTITVLHNTETPEKTFLPASYVVNTWNVKSKALVNSTAHYNQWVRVGKFDLPTLVTAIQATGQTAPAGTSVDVRPTVAAVAPNALDAKTIRFSHHKLLQK